MSDIFCKEKRSSVMKAVKSRNTKTTELKMIEIFKELHIIGWRRTYPLIGKPDFVFPKKRIAVFVDGCFWHGHDCRNVTPSDNADFGMPNALIINNTMPLSPKPCKIKIGR